jgi:Peptidase family S41
MKKSIITILILVMGTSSFSQNKCNCKQSLSQLIKKIESGYPGFNVKTTDTIIYNDFKDRLIIESRNTKDSDCSKLLKHYLSYFRDPHVSLLYTNENKTQIPKSDKKSENKVDIVLDDFYKHISRSKDELEGVWKSPYYKVGIIKVNNNYQGFIIEASNESWKANEIKFSLMQEGKANYYMGNHSLKEDSYELFDGSILSFKDINAVFLKELPKPKLTEKEIELKLDKIQGFYFTKLSNKTSLLCISSFEDAYVEKIEKIISDNQQTIENCENLIIDVRNNLGGTYDAYDELLPYIITNNIRSVGMEFLVTQTLIDDVENWFDDEEGKKKARRWISMFEGNIGKFVNTDTSNVYMTEIKTAENSPKQIAILINNWTASSGEAFVFSAKQSEKVKILGIPTYGAMDYGSASLFDFGCPNYQLQMPTWRARRLPDYPIDNIGIQPDIYLDKSVEDWVQYAIEYLEN